MNLVSWSGQIPDDGPGENLFLRPAQRKTIRDAMMWTNQKGRLVMWMFELYRILTAQRIAEMLREVDRARLAERMTADRPAPRPASSRRDRDREQPATFPLADHHTG